MENGNEKKQDNKHENRRITRLQKSPKLNFHDPKVQELYKKEREKEKVKIDQEEGYKYIGGIILIVLVIMVIYFVSMV